MTPDPADLRHLEELRALARDLALRAGEEHRAGSSETLETESKSSPTDLVSQVDRRTEEVLVAALTRARPHDAIVAEEGTLVSGSTGVRWLIDPLDGTTNYLYGYPVFCVSIAVEVDGRLQVGVVHETPTGHTYEAVAGEGAVCDGRPIAVRRSAALDTALVATGFSYDPELRGRQGAALAHILPRIGDVRRGGSAALDLCQVAAGHLDGYFELDLGLWDYAAGSVIAAAAGADVRHIAAASGRGPAVVAAAPALMPPLLALLADAGVLPPASFSCSH
ncbi:MAG TPA: inositol monophosphatase family protein [Thermoleophilia bacterium]|nr:inositol monophosphatase family protein [Thermoleophilia bacterium]